MKKLQEFPLTGLATLLLTYITLCGALWHLGYWSTFDFNYLEYASISDLFKSSIYPLIKNSWFIIIVCVFSLSATLFMNLTITKAKPKIKPYVNTWAYTLNRKVLAALIIVCGAVIFYSSGLLWRNPKSWNYLPYVFSLFFAVCLIVSGFLKSYIKSESNRLFFFLLILSFPAFCFGMSKKESIQAKLLFKYNEVLYVSTQDTLLNKTLYRTAYLGATSNQYFFLVSGRVVVVNSGKVDALMLQKKLNDENYKLWRNYYSY